MQQIKKSNTKKNILQAGKTGKKRLMMHANDQKLSGEISPES